MATVVSAVLAEAALAESRLGSTTVTLPLELELDLGNLLAIDPNNQEFTEEQMPTEDQLLSLGRDGAQILLNSLWQLETERVEDAVVAKLPPPTYRLPREKPAPKPKAMTKWEKYAKEKGIDKKKKKDRMVWDDVVSKWVPQFGYKKVVAEQERNWCMPVKSNAPDDENPYEKLAEAKREKVAKNELQRLRNLAKSKKVTVPSLGVLPAGNTQAKGVQEVRSVSQSEDLRRAAEVAKSSTASLGKFQKDLSKKLEKSAKTKGSKRKFESNTGDNETEKAKSLRVLESLGNKREKMDLDAAVNKQIFKEDIERRTEKEKERESKGKMKKGGKGKRTKSHFVNKGGKGKFTGKTGKPNRTMGQSKAQKKKANPSKRK